MSTRPEGTSDFYRPWFVVWSDPDAPFDATPTVNDLQYSSGTFTAWKVVKVTDTNGRVGYQFFLNYFEFDSNSPDMTTVDGATTVSPNRGAWNGTAQSLPSNTTITLTRLGTVAAQNELTAGSKAEAYVAPFVSLKDKYTNAEKLVVTQTSNPDVCNFTLRAGFYLADRNGYGM